MLEDALMLLEQAKKSGQGPWQELAIVVLLLSQGICHERLKIVKGTVFDLGAIKGLKIVGDLFLLLDGCATGPNPIRLCIKLLQRCLALQVSVKSFATSLHPKLNLLEF